MVVVVWGLLVSSCGLALAVIACIGIANAKPVARTPFESLPEAYIRFIETSRYQNILF